MHWNMEELSRPPERHPAPAFEEPGVEALFFDAPEFGGRPTRSFAWIGLPEAAVREPVPGMVLVHGGGGTAFAEWVRLWTSRGYAAIAMDTCGCVPGGESGKRPRHEMGGPAGWGDFARVDEPVTEQWAYHAVADVILAHSLLRSLPQVDAERIGVTGISWGGYLTCITAGVDRRFRFAVPVYGCGFLGDNSVWLQNFRELGPQRAGRWLELWDPSRYLPAAGLPMLWVTGTNDFAYPMDSLRKSYRLPPGQRTLCVRVRMPHGHGGAGEKPPEIAVFADSVLRGGDPLARIPDSRTDDRDVEVRFRADVPIVRAELCFTADTGPWPEREWRVRPAELDAGAGRVRATVPDDAAVWYVNLLDERGCVVSAEHVERGEESGGRS